MLEEIIKVKVANGIGEISECELYLFEEDPNNLANVKIELHHNKTIVACSADNYFEALEKLRSNLEKEEKIILCRGANRNVYPSAMQLNMGSGRKAYSLIMGKQAKLDDIVDIFDSSDIEPCVSCVEQKIYFDMWLKSLGE